MRPVRQRLDPREPTGDRRVVARNIAPEFLSRVVEVARERNVGDGRTRAKHERRFREPLVQDGERVVDAALEKRHAARVGLGGKVLQEPVRTEIAVDLLVIEQEPAQALQLLIVILWSKLAGAIGQVGEDYARLAEL